MPVSSTLRMYVIVLVALSTVFWGVGGVRRFVRRALDCRRIRSIWYLPLILLMPAVTVLAYVVMRGLARPLPPVDMPLAALPVFSVVYLCSAACEQLGWTALVTDLLLRRWDALSAALAVGIMWAVWHIIPYARAGNGAAWIVWQCVFTVVIVSAYMATRRSVFATIVVHATDDVSWSLFPNFGSHYDPAVTGVILVIVAVAITLGWGRRTLAPPGHSLFPRPSPPPQRIERRHPATSPHATAPEDTYP